MQDGKQIELTDLIGPSFYPIFHDVFNNKHSEYFIKGGRGSLKSSTVAILLAYGLESNPLANAMVLRDTTNNINDTVLNQVLWALKKLGVEHKWHLKKHPGVTLTRKGTNQKIYFRGASDPNKTKSILPETGYFQYVWFEEADSFRGMHEISNIRISLARSAPHFTMFLTYNPPNNPYCWINQEVKIPMAGRLVHHSSYLDAPADWLEQEFIRYAVAMKQSKPLEYQHTYLGDVVGTGRQVFSNLRIQQILQEQIDSFTCIRVGLDWGYYPDPYVLIKCALDKKRQDLYIYEEFVANKLVPTATIQVAKKFLDFEGQHITADSSEPSSIQEYKNKGLATRGALKGNHSRKFGIDYLKGLRRIIIDPVKCPNATREFSLYELSINRFNDIIPEYPDINDHTIDATRYAIEKEMLTKSKSIMVVTKGNQPALSSFADTSNIIRPKLIKPNSGITVISSGTYRGIHNDW